MSTQVTLISLYGDKNEDFSAAIKKWQQVVAEGVGSAFTPYDVRQIHATIIGLERVRAPAYNANFSTHRKRDVAMNFDGLLAYVRGCGHVPFEVQLGGFAQRDYPFTSRENTPYERSLSVQGDKVVVIGWPVRGEPFSKHPATPADAIREARTYPLTLDIIRHAMQGFGVLHGYHRTLTDIDNDLFFRIGLIDLKATTPAMTGDLEIRARRLLSTQRALVLEIRLEDIYIAAYDDDRLPVGSTQLWSLADPRVTGQFVAGLFT
jgi:hypothetical protein